MITIKLPLELKLFILFYVYYLMSLFFAGMAENVNSAYLMLIGYFAILNIKYIRYLCKFLIVYIIIILILIAIGLYNKNYTSYLFYDFICFGSFLICFNKFYFCRPISFYTSLWPRASFIISTFSILFLVIYIIIFGYSVANIEYGRGLDDITRTIMSPKYFVSASIFLYPLKFYFNNKWIRTVFNINFFSYIFFSLAMGSRGTTLMAIFVLIISNFFDPRKSSRIEFKEILSLKSIILCAVVIFSMVILYNIEQVRGAIDYLVFRFQNEELGEDRFDEANYVYNSLSTIELIIGKGLGAANSYWPSDNPHGVNVVHYGWMFLILKGGVLLLVFIYLNFFYALFEIYRNPVFRPYSLILISFFLLEISHTNFSSFLNMSFVFIAFAASKIKHT